MASYISRPTYTITYLGYLGSERMLLRWDSPFNVVAAASDLLVSLSIDALADSPSDGRPLGRNIQLMRSISTRETGGQWSLVSGQWPLVSGQWSLVSGQWSLISGQWSLISGQWSLISGQWFLVSGQWFFV